MDKAFSPHKPGVTRPTNIVEARRQITITKSGSQPSVLAPSASFTGRVWVDCAFRREAPARISGAVVTFEPGARTAWHTHPLGQTLVVVSGSGLIQQWGEKTQSIGPGDVIWIPPLVKHWHGASPQNGMSHIAVAEELEGTPVTWMEHVSDEQ